MPSRPTFSEIRDALLSAFPQQFDLEEMTKERLDVRLPEIVPIVGVALNEVVFRLIEWAEACGRLDDLLGAACVHRPDNPDLRRVFYAACAASLRHEALCQRVKQLRSLQPDDPLWQSCHRFACLGLPDPKHPDSEPRAGIALCMRGLSAATLHQGVAESLGLRAALVADREGWLLHDGAPSPQRLRALIDLAVELRRARVVEGVGVAAGLLQVVDGVPRGNAVDQARRLAGRDGVFVDAYCAETLGGGLRFADAGDGARELVPTPPQQDSVQVPLEGALRGRTGAFDALVESVRAAAASRLLRSVAIQGAPGMGKSALRRAALDALPLQGLAALPIVVRGEANLQGDPLGALRLTLRAAVGPVIAGAVCDLADGPADAQLQSDRTRERYVMLDELVVGLGAYGVVVLVVDDAHLLDEPTCAALRFVAASARDRATALWVFARVDGVPDHIAALLGGCDLRHRLEPLSDADAALMLRDLLGEAPPALVERAGGNPLFLRELARVFKARGATQHPADEPLPFAVEGCFDEHFEALGAAARRFVEAASVLGRRFWREAVDALGGAVDAETFTSLLRSSLIARRAPSRFAAVEEFLFVSDVCREVAARRIEPARRPGLHLAAAAWLAARPEAEPGELASHYDQAGDRPRAAHWYARSAQLLARTGTLASTSAQVERVLALAAGGAVDPLDRWMALAARDDVRTLTSQYDARFGDIARLQEIAPGLGPEYVAEAAWRLCHCARLANQRDRAVQAGEAARAVANTERSARWKVLALAELAMTHHDGGDAAARDGAQEALADYLRDSGLDPWLRAHIHKVFGYVAAGVGSARESLRQSLAAASGFREARDDRRQTIALVNVAYAQIRLGRLDEALDSYSTAMDLSRRLDNQRSVAVGTHNVGLVRRIQGDLAAAEEAFADAEGRAQSLEHTRLLSEVANDRAYLALQRGEAALDAAALAVARAVDARTLDLRLAALAVELRARHAASLPTETQAAEARAHCDSPETPLESVVELLAALFALGRADRAELGAAVDRLVAQAGPESPAAAAACRSSLARRYLFPGDL